MPQIVAGLDIYIVVLVLAAAMFAAWEVGKWMGRRLRRKGGAKPSKFDDVSMALLGLLLAFTFGMSISKHDQRRMAVVADGNAIGDFYTCSSLLKEPTRTKLQTVIRQYAQLRLDLVRGGARSSDLESVLAKSDRMHTEMTELVGQALIDGTRIARRGLDLYSDLAAGVARTARVAARRRIDAGLVRPRICPAALWRQAARRGPYPRGSQASRRSLVGRRYRS